MFDQPYELNFSQCIPHPLEKVFHFFEAPENLALITPPALGFRVLSKPPIIMKPGLLIDYEIKPFFFKMHWTSRITVYEPPHRFIDVQEHGPYALWEHVHSFEPQGQSTWVRDRVRYKLPLGLLGRCAHRLKVRRQLESIFLYRQSVLKKLFS